MVTVPLLAAAVRKGDGALIQAAAALSAVGTFSAAPARPSARDETSDVETRSTCACTHASTQARDQHQTNTNIVRMNA